MMSDKISPCCATCKHLIILEVNECYPKFNTYFCGDVILYDDSPIDYNWIGYILPPNKETKGVPHVSWCPLLED